MRDILSEIKALFADGTAERHVTRPLLPGLEDVTLGRSLSATSQMPIPPTRDFRHF